MVRQSFNFLTLSFNSVTKSHSTEFAKSWGWWKFTIFVLFALLPKRNERKSSFDVRVIEKSFFLNLLSMGQKISAMPHSMNFAALQTGPWFTEIKSFTKEGYIALLIMQGGLSAFFISPFFYIPTFPYFTCSPTCSSPPCIELLFTVCGFLFLLFLWTLFTCIFILLPLSITCYY